MQKSTSRPETDAEDAIATLVAFDLIWQRREYRAGGVLARDKRSLLTDDLAQTIEQQFAFCSEK